MAKIRHIALATRDPEKVAAFYKAAFDMKEVGRAGPPNPKFRCDKVTGWHSGS